MQIDMHYYGTYCLARAAGLNQESSRIIAYAAQFVDDNVAANVDDHDDGSQLYAIPTAHHVGDLSNREADDQRYIWVPFHFLPGAEGSKFTEKLICRKNSGVSQEMVAHHADQGHRPFGLELLGITAHVYADTFAHYGFSGVSSRRNKVDGGSLVLVQDDAVVEAALGRSFGSWIKKHGGFLNNIRSRISSVGEFYSGALGHGGVSNYPDLPFLQWSFTYEETGETVTHDNPATFLECATMLYALFQQYAQQHAEHRGTTSVPWNDIEKRLMWIYAQEGNKWDRADIWKSCFQNGDFGISEEIPEYEADEWNDQCDHLADMDDGADGLDLEVHRFYSAASYHLHYVLRELLPAHGLMVI
jgi:hypothetical protein